MINNTHKNVHILDKINDKIPRSIVNDTETVITHDLCYRCSKYGPDYLFGKLSIKYSNDTPHFPEIIKLISNQIEMNTLFKTNDEKKEVYVIKVYTSL